MFKIFLCCWCLMYVCIFLVKVTEWPPIRKIAPHSASEMFSWYKYLIVGLVFSHLGFWSGSLFLIATFPDLCLLVLFLSRFRPERLSSIQMVSQKCIIFAWRHKQPIYFFRAQCVGTHISTRPPLYQSCYKTKIAESSIK